MSTTFLISDLHFGHTNALKFVREDGQPLRPFPDVETMDETIISNWNSVVGPNDKVIVLGDVVINKKHLDKVARLNGTKSLILGNHDLYSIELMGKYFTKVFGSREYDGFVLTHIPVHENQLERWKGCVHGHLHSNYVKLADGDRDRRYFNVSCDCTDMNFFPKAWDDIKKTFEFKKETE